MQQVIQGLQTDITSTLTFWKENILQSENIVGELSCLNRANLKASIGSMYLSRIIYGCAAGDKTLNSKVSKDSAEKALKMLLEDFKNPAGGYYWAIDANGQVEHDVDNINMAQAFVIYGLAEYASVYGDSKVIEALKDQLIFVENTIRDKEDKGYVDGFDKNWNIISEKSRFFGTHIHLLEAFVKVYQLDSNLVSLDKIEELIEILTTHFIHSENYNRIHQLGMNWEAKPSNVWAGHDAECSWILCDAARITQNKNLIEKCEQLALNQMQYVCKYAFDKEYGGVYNEMVNNKPATYNKDWWPQAECVLGLLNAFNISKDIAYYDLAIGLIGYIQYTFLSPEGEWYCTVDQKGNPDLNIPKVNFWKSMYHNVRYYTKAIQELDKH